MAKGILGAISSTAKKISIKSIASAAARLAPVATAVGQALGAGADTLAVSQAAAARLEDQTTQAQAEAQRRIEILAGGGTPTPKFDTKTWLLIGAGAVVLFLLLRKRG